MKQVREGSMAGIGVSDAQPAAVVAERELPAFPLEYFGSFQNVLVEKKIRSGWRVLEIGCSAGYYSRRLVARGARVFGMDLNTPLVAEAARACSTGNFCSAEASRLPFVSATFDAVVMLEVIEHVGEEPPVIEEIRRVLKPGGKLFLSTPHAGTFAFMDTFNVKISFMQRYPRLTAAISKFQRYRGPQLTSNMEEHKHYSLERIEKLFGRGLNIQFVHRGGLFIFPLFAAAHAVIARVVPWRPFRRLCLHLMALDASIDYGRRAYNVVVIAERMEQS
jgi:2-polyprenyl-3-methyl-5-hydroxy-6-metoxy-1,4-benzoquinol methylase